MIKYQVRSRDLIDMVNDIKSEKLILSPYFQRNLVWREIHQKDFIETILKGYPFPQIFIARGDINVDDMTSTSCVVDGQQRMNAVREYLAEEFAVGGRFFGDLGTDEKEEFLKYQIPVIDLDVKATDPTIIDIFKRLNRTFYALSTIEKMSTEYATVDFMLVAKFLCNLVVEKDYSDEEDGIDLTVDPNMPVDFMPWAKTYDVESYRTFIFDERLFSSYETSRLVHLMYTLNIISTVSAGIFSRNDKTRELLEAKDDLFPYRDSVIEKIGATAKFVLSLDMPAESIWWNKASAFTLFVLVFWNIDKLARRSVDDVKQALVNFEQNLPEAYTLAAREAVNNRKQRLERHQMLARSLNLTEEEKPFGK